MLHELLLALGGYPGNIFIRTNKDDIQLLSNLPFIAPSEETLLNRLCKLASHYCKFIEFIRKYGHSPSPVGKTNGEVKTNGLYQRALCQGLDHVLAPYRAALLELEQQLLQDPHLTPAHVQSHLEQYHMLFPALSSILDQIQTQKAHGCQILEILHKSSGCGMPLVQQAVIQLLHKCHGVLYKQLTAWMLHGLLFDHFDEFFVHRVQKVDSVATTPVEEDELGLGGLTGKQIKQMLQLSEPVPELAGIQQYGLNSEMLPSYLSVRVAQKVLFVGESVQMFDSDSDQSSTRKKQTKSVLENREDEFAQELLTLSRQQEFSLMAFEGVVDKIRTYVAEQLWQLVVVDADLIGQLRVLKDFYLLGRGELFLSFIDTAQGLLRSHPTNVTTVQHDINVAFQQAYRNVLLADEGLLQKIKLTLQSKDHNTKDVSRTESGWDMLKLNYTIDWPLHILLTQGVLDRYNSVLTFLLHVKRAQLELQQCWALQMRLSQKTLDKALPNHWQLRNHMAFLLDNLQYFLQVDVIESQFSVLVDHIQNTRDFEAICHAHDNFLSSLLSQCFLLTKPIHHCLSEILDLCHGFCVLMMNAENDLTDRETSQIDGIAKNFQRQSSLLFKILSSVRNHQSSPHLAQLLLRIDFNKYFTMAGGQLGSYQAVSADRTPPSSSRR